MSMGAGVPVSTEEPGRPERKASEVGSAYMHEMAFRTGGRELSADTGDDLKEAFRKIAEELKRQYALSYYPSKPPGAGERRKLKVRVDRPKVAVRARQEYVSRPSDNE